MIHNGLLRTMKANYVVDAGDISVIRPLIYCRESIMTDFAKASNLPVINENCPACFEEPKERARMKKMLSREETLYPNMYDNFRYDALVWPHDVSNHSHCRRALMPLMHDDMAPILKSYVEETIARGKNGKTKPILPAMPDKVTSPVKADNVVSLTNASDADLLQELARRKVDRFRSGQRSKDVKKNTIEIPIDPTNQVCSANGEHGIRCYELME